MAASRGKTIAAAAAALVWMAFIFYMSAKSGEGSGSLSGEVIGFALQLLTGHADPEAVNALQHPVRKLAHFSEYAVLGALLANLVRIAKARRGWYAAAWAAGALYAASDELHQSFVPGRAAMVSDVCIDACGALFGVLVLALVVYLARRRRSYMLHM